MVLLSSRAISTNGIYLKNHSKAPSDVFRSVRSRSSSSIKSYLGSRSSRNRLVAVTINGSYSDHSFATTTPGYCFIGSPQIRSAHSNKDPSFRRKALNHASPQRRILSTTVATLQNDEYEDMDDNNIINKRSRLQEAYDTMFEESKTKLPSQNKVYVSPNHQNTNFYDLEEEEEHEMMLGAEDKDEYIDYISSFEDKQTVQLSSQKDDIGDNSSLGQEAKAPTSQGNDTNTIMVNEEASAIMDDLFKDDFPASLPLSQQEIKETNDMVQTNHDRYAQYHQTDSTKEIKKEVNQIPKQQVEKSSSFVSPQKAPPKASSQKTLTSKYDNNDVEQADDRYQSSTSSKSSSSSSSSLSRLSPPPQKMKTSEKEILQFTIHQIQTQIYKLNNNEEFNIHSYKQVSKVLFGVETESTNREVLEGLTGNIVQHLDSSKNISELAKLILEFRKLHSRLKKMERAEANKANGSHVNHYNQNTIMSKQNSGDTKGSFSAAVNSNHKGNDNTSSANNGNGSGDKSIPNELTLGHKHHQDGDTAIEPLVLIDASAYIFRAYYSMPPIHRFDGEPTGATLGFCNMLNRLVLTPSFLGQEEYDGESVLPPRVVLVFDSKDATNFRKELYPEYKANRKACPIDLVPQFDFVRDAADAYGILQLEAAGYEADDVIATIATKALEEGCFVNILSGDKDLMQLVTQDELTESEDNGIEPCIQLIDPMNMVRVDYKGVIDKWGVEPERLGDVLALAGDTADNVPGVPGIGPKIAVSLIQEYGSLEGILANVDDIKQKARREKLKENTDMVSLLFSLIFIP